MEDQKNKNLPPKIDAQKMEAQLQEEKKKEVQEARSSAS